MAILSQQQQDEIRAWVRAEYPDGPPTLIRLSEIHVAAYRELAQTLGVEWCDRTVSPIDNTRSPDFLRRELASRDDSLIHVDRVIHLAEYLTSLASVSNFAAKLDDLRAKGLEEAFYELRVAQSLNKRGRLARFVVPSGVKGQDFDLEARLDTHSIAVEVKCLTDEPIYSPHLLYNRLKKAATQLPKAGPATIFVMLPAAWLQQESFRRDTTHTMDYIFRNYSRVNSIFLHWEEWSGGPPYARILKFHATTNAQPKVTVANIEMLVEAAPSPAPDLQQLIQVSYI